MKNARRGFGVAKPRRAFFRHRRMPQIAVELFC
jgi:hypothetical protein